MKQDVCEMTNGKLVAGIPWGAQSAGKIREEAEKMATRTVLKTFILEDAAIFSWDFERLIER